MNRSAWAETLATGLALVILSGCSAQKGTPFAPTSVQSVVHPFTPEYKVLFSFNGPDGSMPTGLATLKTSSDPLNVHGGEFYGTTEFGGNDDVGTFFSLTAEGKEHVLYSFREKRLRQNEEYPDSILTSFAASFSL